MMKLLEFDYMIKYKKGSQNLVADALSRKYVLPSWVLHVQASYIHDPKCRQLLQEIAIKDDSHPPYTLTTGILRYKNRIIIGASTDLKQKIFHSVHASSFGGHSGQRLTYHRLKQVFLWPDMKQFIDENINQCPVCQISKTERLPYPGLLQPLNIPKRKWGEISMDFVEGLPKSHGKDVIILVIVDRLKKYAHFLPMSHPYSVHTGKVVHRKYLQTTQHAGSDSLRSRPDIYQQNVA
jgi:hypothetical protein